MQLSGMILKKEGNLKASDKLRNVLEDEAKKVKIKVPFQADGFKSEKTPLQPDGVTPVVVEEANLVNSIKTKDVTNKTKAPEKENKKISVAKSKTRARKSRR